MNWWKEGLLLLNSETLGKSPQRDPMVVAEALTHFLGAFRTLF